MNKKLLTYSLAIAGLGALVAGPALAMINTTGTTTAKTSLNYCSRLTTVAANADLRLADLQKKLDAKRSERSANIEKRRADRENKLATARSNWNTRRDARYDKILGKAATDEQKLALANFKAAVEAAVVERKAAIDSAISVFRAGLDAAITGRAAGMDAALVAYKTSVQAAETKAAADCAAGVKSIDVATALKSSVKAARDKFKADRLAVAGVNDAVKTLNAARKAAFDKAISDFKAAVEAAKTMLKSAFPLKTKATSTPANE